MKKDEAAYLVPDNTILNTPRRDLVFFTPNPHLPLLGVRLHDLDLTPSLAGLFAAESLIPLWRSDNSC